MRTRIQAALLVATSALACGGRDPVDRVDAAHAIVDAAGPRYDAGPGVACLDTVCVDQPVCCRVLLDPGMPITFCAPDSTSCPGSAYSCDGPEDCADGEQCCSTGDGVECLPAGTCPVAVVCHSAADCSFGPCCDTPVGIVKACYSGC